MRSLVAALSLAWLTALIAFAAAPYRAPAWPLVIKHVAKDQSRVPFQPLIPRSVRTETYQLVAMPRPRPNPEKRRPRH